MNASYLQEIKTKNRINRSRLLNLSVNSILNNKTLIPENNSFDLQAFHN